MLELPMTLELDHHGMHIGTIECVVEISPFHAEPAAIYMIGTTGHFTSTGLKEHRIQLSTTDSDPLLKGIARQAWEVARLPSIQGQIEEIWIEESAGARAAYRYDSARQSEAA